VRRRFRADARQACGERRRIITTRDYCVGESLCRLSRLITLHRNLTKTNVGPCESGSERKRLFECGAENLLGVVGLILTKQRASKNDLRILKTRRADKHRARSRLGFG